MPNYPSRSLADRFISESFQDILQIYNGDLVLDGTGTLLFNVSDIGTGGGGPSVSSSYALSASYAPTILPQNIVSSSLQINTGSFTGSFVGQVTASYMKLLPQSSLSNGEGTMFYDSVRRALAVVDDSLTTLYPSEDQLIRITNNSGVTIPKGSVVEYDGSPGGSGRILGKLAIAINRSSISSLSSLSERIKLLGLAHETILHGADGHVMVSGEITNVNTNTFTNGQALYLSETVSGSITGSVNSNFDQHRVGFALNSHSTQGRIYVNEFLDHRIFYTSILDVPIGIVSSSVQAATWTVASSSWASTSISSSYATTTLSASYAPGSPSVSASYAVTSSYALNGGGGGTTTISSSNYYVTNFYPSAPPIPSASTDDEFDRLSLGSNWDTFNNGNPTITVNGSQLLFMARTSGSDQAYSTFRSSSINSSWRYFAKVELRHTASGHAPFHGMIVGDTTNKFEGIFFRNVTGDTSTQLLYQANGVSFIDNSGFSSIPVVTVAFTNSSYPYISIEKTPTNILKFYYSADAINWSVLYELTASTNLGTIDRVGFYTYTSANQGQTTASVDWLREGASGNQYIPTSVNFTGSLHGTASLATTSSFLSGKRLVASASAGATYGVAEQTLLNQLRQTLIDYGMLQ